MSFPTLRMRKDAKVTAMRTSVERLAEELADYARANGGVFTLFGSAARGDLRFDSDVDILVDFPADLTTDAWVFAEARAFAHGLEPDVQIKALSGAKLLARIAAEGRVLR